eukprot:1618629-Pyramimonas_sp.AAC.1
MLVRPAGLLTVVRDLGRSERGQEEKRDPPAPLSAPRTGWPSAGSRRGVAAARWESVKKGVVTLPFCDWCPLRVYSLSPSAIGARYGYIHTHLQLGGGVEGGAAVIHVVLRGVAQEGVPHPLAHLRQSARFLHQSTRCAILNTAHRRDGYMCGPKRIHTTRRKWYVGWLQGNGHNTDDACV